MTTLKEFDIAEIEVGYASEGFDVEPVMVVALNRATFVGIVRGVLDAYDLDVGDELRASLLAVARTMPRFPFGHWLQRTRGCGCVVGEYLVGSGLLERTPLLSRHVEDLFTQEEFGEDSTLLLSLGIAFDEAVEEYVLTNVPEFEQYTFGGAVLILDEVTQ